LTQQGNHNVGDIFLDTIEGSPAIINNRVPIPDELAGSTPSEPYVWTSNVSDANRNVHSPIESGNFIFFSILLETGNILPETKL
jgi:hypothetical protein